MKNQFRFLLVEDDKYTRLFIKEILSSYGLVFEADSLEGATQILNSEYLDIVITDIELGKGSGTELIPLCHRKNIPCIVVSSYDGDEIIEKAYQNGAHHYLSKAQLKDDLPHYLRQFSEERGQLLERLFREEFITEDHETREAIKKLSKLQWKDQSLLITGETGTGKSFIGKLIHDLNQSGKNLVHLNCSELSDNLLESELFGHEKGAFTGAESKKDGKLKLADGGTLFLDEVATMSLSMQQKLLKAIDEKEFYPVGSQKPIKSSFTLISATCEDLKEKVNKKEFREDLYYRLKGYELKLKPLRERPQDIILYIRFFQRRSNRKFIIKEEALEVLKNHSWQGNTRELKKYLERLAQISHGIIQCSDLTDLKPTSLSAQEIDHVIQIGLKQYIQDLEKKAVESSLKKNNGKITACIKELKISSSAFYRILNEHKLHF